MKPLIGIVSRPNITVNKSDCHVMEEVYKNAIINSGGIPFMISPMQNISYQSLDPKDVPLMTDLEKEDLNILLELCNGILIPGGTKVYEYDSYICKYAKEKNIPVLGICAGMQLMARIDCDNYNKKIENNSHQSKGGDDEYIHEVNIIKDSLLYKIIGKEKIKVNSFHSYQVNTSGIYDICALSSEDNIIEGIEYKKHKFYMGVQWHPERCFDENSKKLFKYFIEVSKK